MRTHTLLLIPLLGLLLWASCSQASDTEDNTEKQTETQGESSEETTEESPGEEEQEESNKEPKKEKTTEIEEEKHVMVLHVNNFDRALSENQYLLVEFCKLLLTQIPYVELKCAAVLETCRAFKKTRRCELLRCGGMQKLKRKRAQGETLNQKFCEEAGLIQT